MRVFDAVIIDGEEDLDLLEARFAELEGIPEVVHVICEAAAGYRGEPKPEHFAGTRYSRFARWHGRWNHVQVAAAELPAGGSPKVRKDALREFLAHGVNGAGADIVMHGNVDEIPAERAVRALAAGETVLPVTLEMRWCAYTAARVHPLPWRGTAADRWQRIGSFAGLRERRGQFPALIGAGTRLSMLGAEPRDTHPDGHGLWPARIDGSWPRVVREATCPGSWLVEA